ncbi:MAG: hypothetical protein QM703_18205 [Gemmatales bacterium]
MQRRELPAGWDKNLPVFPADAKGLATRESSGKVINALAQNVPWLIGGAADLAPSTKTRLTFEGAGDFLADNHGGATSTLAFVNMPWGLSSMAWLSARCGPMAPGS